VMSLSRHGYFATGHGGWTLSHRRERRRITLFSGIWGGKTSSLVWGYFLRSTCFFGQSSPSNRCIILIPMD